MKIKKVRDDITKRLLSLLEIEKIKDAFLARKILPLYRETQFERFKTQNAGPLFTGGKWKPLNQKYAERKLKKYASFPGAGRHLLVATTEMSIGLVGDAPHGRTLIQNGKLEVATTVPYTAYHDEGGQNLPRRRLLTFSSVYTKKVQKEIDGFVRGVLSGGRR